MANEPNFETVELPDLPHLSEVRDIADGINAVISEFYERWLVIEKNKGSWSDRFYEARRKEIEGQAWPGVEEAVANLCMLERDARSRHLEIMRPEHPDLNTLAFHAEIRASLRELDEKARKKVLDAALKDADSLVLGAVTGGRYFLSGMASEEARVAFSKKAAEALTQGELKEIDEQLAAIATVTDHAHEARKLIEQTMRNSELPDFEPAPQMQEAG